MNNAEVSRKKWEVIMSNLERKFTCYYSPNEKHALCPHQESCILNKEFADTYAEINQNKKQIKELKNIYDDSIEDFKKTNKGNYVGFSPKSNVLNRKILEHKNKKNYQKLKELKTKKGGYI